MSVPIVCLWKTPRLAAIMLLSAAPVLCMSADLAHAVDLAVTNIEVTQAIQTTTNTIQLVAQRSTAARATVVNLDGAAVPGVTGRLHVFVDGAEITPGAGVAPINAPFTVPVAPQRANENDTLNFELPAPSGIAASGNVRFRVDVTPAPGEINTANNTLTTGALTAVNRTTPSLFFTRINWIGTGLPHLSLVQPGVGDAFVRGIYPVNDSDPNLYRQGLFPSLPFNEDPDNNGVLEALGTEGNDLMSFLASCRQLIVNMGLGATNNTFLIGWIKGNPINGNGLGQIGGFNAFANTDPIRSQRSYAHELTHNFGQDHNTRSLDQVGWDVGARLPNNPVTNNTTGRVKPTTLKDIMFAGLFTNQAWVDTITYNVLLGSAVLSDSPDARGDKPSARVLVVQGIFDPTGARLLRLKPAFRYPWASQPTLRPFVPIPDVALPEQILLPEQITQVGFAAEVIDSAGAVTRMPFDPSVADDAGNVTFGFFEVMVAVPPEREVASLRITDTQGVRTYGVLRRVSTPPTISVAEPRPRQHLGHKTDVAWHVGHAHIAVEHLLYQVAYSPDGGQSWVPLAVDVPGTATSVVVDTTEIQQSNGNGVIRVFVSDGLYTAFADVTNLSTPAALYSAP
jgi:hypothetical protein